VTTRLFSEKRHKEESWMTKTEQVRLARWRMKVLRHVAETTQNVSQTCRYFGISRKTFYKWKARYEELGEAGLCDRSRANFGLSATIS
jgi:transcriptional regulator with PAS, ATPase and Fis domain